MQNPAPLQVHHEEGEVVVEDAEEDDLLGSKLKLVRRRVTRKMGTRKKPARTRRAMTMEQTLRRRTLMVRTRLKAKQAVPRQREVRVRKYLDLSRKTKPVRARELEGLADATSFCICDIVFAAHSIPGLYYYGAAFSAICTFMTCYDELCPY